MAIVQCSNGHFYDDMKNATCPMCQEYEGPHWRMDDDKTVSLDWTNASEIKTVYLSGEETVKPKVIGNWDDEKTVAFYGDTTENLLVGWLVCIQGCMKGKDYRIYAGFNRIGRSLNSDICLQDPQVSKENHCSVVYDGKSNSFYLVPGQGIVYLDQITVQKAEILLRGSRISLGECVLEFVPFCEGDHIWKTL